MRPAVEPLFQSFALPGLDLANRLVMAPMTRGFAPFGVPSREVANYYRRRAEGGVGLIVTEGVIVDHLAAQGVSGQGGDLPVLHGEQALAAWKDVVSAVHAAGVPIMPQLWHMGVMREDGCPPYPNVPSCRPSGLWGPTDRDSALPMERRLRQAPPTRPMSERDIADVIAAFAASARNAMTVGFDGIALHGGHGYLIDSFFWEETNRRNDAYGGDIVRRARFGAEVVRAIRAVIGAGRPIIFRFSQWKQQDFQARIAGGPDELAQILAPLVDAGVDLFDVSTRRFEQPAFTGSELTLAGWTRKVTGVPTMAVGGIGLSNDLYTSFAGEEATGARNVDEVVERLLQGEFDLVALGRSLLADAAWPRTLREGGRLKSFDRGMLAVLA